MLAGFYLLALNVTHTVNTKVMPLWQLLQWSAFPSVVFLQETGVLPPRFVGAPGFFSSNRVSPEIGNVCVENESVFPSDDYPVWLRLHTLPAFVATGYPASRARFKLPTSVCKWQQLTYTDNCAGLHPLPPAATLEAYRHFVCAPTTAAEAVFEPPYTQDTVPGLVCTAAKVLHTLLKAHRRS